MKVRFYLHTNNRTIYMDCRWGRESYAPADQEAKVRLSTTVQLSDPEFLKDGVVSNKEKEYAKKRIRLSDLEKLAYQIGQRYETKGETLYPATLKKQLPKY